MSGEGEDLPQEEEPAQTPEVDLNADVAVEEVPEDPNVYPDPDNPVRSGPF